MQIFASADREPAVYPSDNTLPRDAQGLLYHVSYTAEGGGTATLDVKLQYYDPISDSYEDYRDWEGNVVAIAQMTGVGEDDFVVYPSGVGQLAASQPSATFPRFPIPHPRRFRVVATVGTDNLTFSIAGIPLA